MIDIYSIILFFFFFFLYICGKYEYFIILKQLFYLLSFSSMDVMPDDGLKQKALQELKQIFPQHNEKLLMNAVLSTWNFHLSPPDLLSNDFPSFLQHCINEFLVTDGKQTV